MLLGPGATGVWPYSVQAYSEVKQTSPFCAHRLELSAAGAHRLVSIFRRIFGDAGAGRTADHARRLTSATGLLGTCTAQVCRAPSPGGTA